MKAVNRDGGSAPGARNDFLRLARITGGLYLLLAVCGMFAQMVVETSVVAGDAAATAGKILGSRWLFTGSLVSWIVVVGLDVALAVTLWQLLESAGRALALVTAAIRVVYAAILGAVVLNLYDAFLLLTGAGRGVGLGAAQRQSLALADLEAFRSGFLFALIFFGLHLVALGCLFYRSRALPRLFGLLLFAGGIGYIVDSLGNFFVAGYGGLVTAIVLAPAVIGELGLTAWLLVKGLTVPQGATGDGVSGVRPLAADVQIVRATGGMR